ncbi:MAG TPA: RNA polymerase sigma-54 factor, partial [Desulfobaccales bacterium]|nr:RNA polymerase sigma-54 factor [Desulfobaccales bacterium]
MALEIRQSLKLTQSLIMTQKLQQAIKLLQLSRMELVGEITQALETNPVLEDDQFPEEQVSGEAESGLEGYANGGELQAEESKTDGEAKSAQQEWDWDSFLKDRLMPSPVGEYHEDREALPFESINAEKTTLKSHLLWQLRMAELGQQDQNIGEMIIGNLDKDGYLRSTVDEIAAEMGVDPGRVEQVLGVIQGFDPPGVAARDLQECLRLQLKILNIQEPLLAEIIDRHLTNLGNKNYQAIARDLKVPLDKVVEAGDLIANLEPKPG